VFGCFASIAKRLLFAFVRARLRHVFCLRSTGALFFYFPLGVPKVPLRPLGTDRFLLRLRSDLAGVWLFRIHCQAAAVLCLRGLGCVTFFVYVLGLFSFPLGVPKVPLRPLGTDRFLPCRSSDLGGV